MKTLRLVIASQVSYLLQVAALACQAKSLIYWLIDESRQVLYSGIFQTLYTLEQLTSLVLKGSILNIET